MRRLTRRLRQVLRLNEARPTEPGGVHLRVRCNACPNAAYGSTTTEPNALRAKERVPAQVGAFVEEVQVTSRQSVSLAYTNQGNTSEGPVAQAHGIALQVLKFGPATRGLVLLPRQGVVERNGSWSTRYKRWVRDSEHLTIKLAITPLLGLCRSGAHQDDRV